MRVGGTMNDISKKVTHTCGVLTVVLGCVTAQANPTDTTQRDEWRFDETPFEATLPEDHDPFEPVNRAIFQFNRLVDGLLIKPAAMTYNAVLPTPARNSVGSFLTNLKEPLSFASALMQLEGKRATTHTLRFVFNSIFGIFGLVDVASKMGLTAKSEGTEHYLARTGLPSGPYIVLPLLGPSDARGTAGTVADFFADPFNIAARTVKHNNRAQYRYTIPVRVGVSGLHTRSQNVEALDALQRNSFDFYAAVRNAYQQQTKARDSAIKSSN